MPEREAAEPDEPHRTIRRTAQLDEMPQPDGLDDRPTKVEAPRGQEVQDVGSPVEEPLARRVEFLADVLDEPDRVVHAQPAVVLPAALEGDAPVPRPCRLQVDEGSVKSPHICAGHIAWI